MTSTWNPPVSEAADPVVITSLTTTVLDLPLRRPHQVSVHTIDTQSTLLVRIRTGNGLTGIGEGVVPGGPWWGGESIEGMQALVERHLAPIVVGQDARRVDYLARVMDRRISGAPFAKAAVEMALWDVAAKTADLPLYQLLGGVHRTELPVTWAIGAVTAETAIEEAGELLEQGRHRSFKLKMGVSDPEPDTARVVRITEALRDRASVAVDLNGSWDEHTARRWLPALDAAGVSLIEQPVPGWNLAAMARLRGGLRAAVMADEAVLTPHDATAVIANHAADVVAVKLAKCGGIGAVGRVAAVAEAGGLACYGGTTIETSIGTAAAAHAFCATASLTAGTELFGPLLLDGDVVENPVTYRDGYLHLGGGPGLGVRLNEEAVNKYART